MLARLCHSVRPSETASLHLSWIIKHPYCHAPKQEEVSAAASVRYMSFRLPSKQSL